MMLAQNPIPARPQIKSILLLNGTAHVGNGKVIENSAIGFKDGKLTLVTTSAQADKSKWDTVISVQGKHVYPGMISPNTNLGLNEVGAVRATHDDIETGAMNPHVRSLIAYNTDSKVIPTIRTNGILLAQVAPSGGLISGTSSIVELDGWNWEDAAYKIDDGVHLNWPRMQTRNYIPEIDDVGASEKNKDYNNTVNQLGKFFSDAKAYSESPAIEEKNLRFEAMKGVFSGSKTLFIYANFVKEITEAVNFSKRAGVKRVVIIGGKDAWMCADLLKQNNAAVILNRLHNLPGSADDDIDQNYKMASTLQKAGVLFCLNNEAGMEAMQQRNLPFIAGTAAAYGLTKEEALQLVTLNTAKILGIDKKTGSIEEGKDATLFVSDGDALDMKSNNVTLAFIRGKRLNLQNDQYNLYKKYMDKYGMSK